MRGAAALAVAAGLLAGCGGGGGTEPPARGPAFVAAGPADAAGGGVRERGARPTGRRPARFATGALRRPTWLRDGPGGRRIARAGTRTEFGSARVVAIVRRSGRWLGVHAPERPNGVLAWLPASAVNESGTDRWVRIDRSRRRLELRSGSRVLRTITVAVGKPGYATPLGRYAVTDVLRARAGSPYGCCAIALTGHQTKLVPGWPGGDRLAIHGTRQTDSIGRAASLGCLRARDADLRRLMRELPVGAPVVVVA